jgi:hypothetical protein
MHADTYRLTQAIRYILSIVGAVVFTFNVAFPSQAIARSSEESLLESNTSGLVAQGLCETRYGTYVNVDHANRIVNNLRSQGVNAWMEYHGSYLSGTRTYVVFAMLPCR